MSDLVGNPEDRFSCDAAQIRLDLYLMFDQPQTSGSGDTACAHATEEIRCVFDDI